MSSPLSYRHHRVQRLRQLLRRSTVRRSDRAFVVEGEKLVAAALDGKAEVESVYVDSARSGAQLNEIEDLLAGAAASGAAVFDLAPGVIERVADTITPQPVLAVVKMPQCSLEEVTGARFVVVCVEVRDPGNAGAVIRVAGASGADAVVCCEGTVDPFNPKTVRASAGSVLNLPVISHMTAASALDALGQLGLRRLAATSRGGTAYTEAALEPPVALVVGNEAWGLPDPLLSLIDGRVTVPMTASAESLNVATACAVLCFEVARRRDSKTLSQPVLQASASR